LFVTFDNGFTDSYLVVAQLHFFVFFILDIGEGMLLQEKRELPSCSMPSPQCMHLRFSVLLSDVNPCTDSEQLLPICGLTERLQYRLSDPRQFLHDEDPLGNQGSKSNRPTSSRRPVFRVEFPMMPQFADGCVRLVTSFLFIMALACGTLMNFRNLTLYMTHQW
jgi:hypothetical protein